MASLEMSCGKLPTLESWRQIATLRIALRQIANFRMALGRIATFRMAFRQIAPIKINLIWPYDKFATISISLPVVRSCGNM